MMGPFTARLGSALAALALGALAAAPVPAPAQAPDASITYPDSTWEYVWPRRDALEAYGWDADALRDAAAFIRDSANTTGLVVVDRGRIVLEFGDVEDLSYVASVRKSILAMLYGRHVESGAIDLGSTLEEMGMDDNEGLLPVERRATIEHLVTARSGVYHPASNSGDNSADAPPRGSQTPGEYMLYNNWDFNAAGAAFERATGRDIYDELETQLAGPLEFQDWDRSAQRKSGNLRRSRYPAYHMWLSTRDMARIGYLMLREGEWDGRRVLSRDWVRRITSTVTPLEAMNPAYRRDGYLGYGYMWWVWDGPQEVGAYEGAYTARGAWGQWITVLPAIDLVVAHKTNSVYGRTTSWAHYEELLDWLIAARR